MTVRGLLVVLALALQAEPSTALARHCYAVWRYPWPQRCGVETRRAVVSREKAAIELPTDPALALPALGPVEAVEAAGETRARLMLRAALGDPHAD